MTKTVTEQEGLELNKDGSVHGVIVYNWGESPACATYCKYHVDYILNHGWDIRPYHSIYICSGWKCYHGAEPTTSLANDK